MENINDSMHALHAQLHGQPWYAGQVLLHPVSPRTMIAYVHYMGRDVDAAVPTVFEGYNVKMHFIGSLSVLDTTIKKTFPQPAVAPEVKAALETEEAVLAPAGDLHNDLWKLRGVCGHSQLRDIFYEIHDGDDAVTNLSPDYPEVRAKLQSLYDTFGFDVLFEDLDD